MPKYIIAGLSGRLTDRGTPNLPFLHHISSGERGGKSLIFHLQIGLKFVQVTIDKVRKSHVSLKCVTRNKYELDFSLSELRNINNWTVLEN